MSLVFRNCEYVSSKPVYIVCFHAWGGYGNLLSMGDFRRHEFSTTYGSWSCHYGANRDHEDFTDKNGPLFHSVCVTPPRFSALGARRFLLNSKAPYFPNNAFRPSLYAEW